MRELFGEYYRPSDKYFSQLWQDGTFVFDTNVLLHFYRYTPSARDELLRIIESLKDRVWLPHQVGLEFSRNRTAIILNQKKIFDLIDSFDTTLEKSIVENYGTRGHSFVDLNKIRAILQQTKQTLKEELRQSRAIHPDPMEHDQLLDRLDTIFKERIGPPYSMDEMAELSKDFKKRYELKKPPGYKDAGKSNTNKHQEEQEDDPNNPANVYGDVILWFQVIKYAKQERKPIILVIDDHKEDWWRIMHGEKLGPRVELRREMQKEADVPFYIYDVDNFIRKAQEFLKVEVSKDTIEEVREISRQDAKEQISALISQMGVSLAPLYTNGMQNIIQQAIPPNGIQDFVRHIQSTNQIINSLGGLSQLNQSLIQQAIPPNGIQDFVRHIQSTNQIINSLGGLSQLNQSLIQQAIPPNGIQDFLRQVQSTNQIINSLGGLSQLNQSLRLSQNLYRQIQPLLPHSEQQQDEEENQEESLDSEENEQDKKDNSSDDNALDDTEN